MSGKALLKAVTAGRSQQVRLLLQSGAAVDDVDDCGQTPLIRAVFIEHDRMRDRILRLLLRKDAQVSKSDVVGRTALAWSALYGHDMDVKLLLDNTDVDLDLNQVDINGQTMLYHAVASGNAATVKIIVEALLKYGLSVDVTDHEGISPLMHAYRLGYDVCASILTQQGKAKVGLCSRNSKDFTVAQIWAQKYSSDAKVLDMNKLPPIVSRSVKNRIKFRESLATRSRTSSSSVCSDSDVENFITDSESNCSSGDLIFDEDLYNSIPLKNCKNMIPPCHIPSSILAKSPTTCTEGIASSDDEFERILSQMNSSFKLTNEMRKMFAIKQDEMSLSFRKNVKNLPPSISRSVTMSSLMSGTSESSTKSVESGRFDSMYT